MPRSFTHLAFAAFSCLASFSALAQDLSDPKARFRAMATLAPEDIPALRKKAESGDGAAMAMLGEAFALGFATVRQDDAEAAEWLGKAAASGQTWAAREASFYDFKNRNSALVDATALSLSHAKTAIESKEPPAPVVDESLEHAAKLGITEAQMLLARELENGWGAPKDEGQAAQWYEKASEAGDLNADIALYHMYTQGRGVDKNRVTASVHLKTAADGGETQAQLLMARNCLKGWFDGHPDIVGALTWLAIAAKAGSGEGDESFAALSSAAGSEDIVEALNRAADWESAHARPK